MAFSISQIQFYVILYMLFVFPYFLLLFFTPVCVHVCSCITIPCNGTNTDNLVKKNRVNGTFPRIIFIFCFCSICRTIKAEQNQHRLNKNIGLKYLWIQSLNVFFVAMRCWKWAMWPLFGRNLAKVFAEGLRDNYLFLRLLQQYDKFNQA